MRKESDIELLLEALAVGPSQAILNQEARGQKELSRRDMLPKKCPREDLEKLGFVFGEEIDELFISVTMPEGWHKQATDHSMWTDLLDEKGRKRGAIFYKAAFYDRKADMVPLQIRYHIGEAWGDYPAKSDYDSELRYYYVVDEETGNILFHTPALEKQAHWQKESERKAEARAFLKANFPDWENPLAYWD